jgi:predicted ATPase
MEIFMQDDVRFINTIQFKNLLSFGKDSGVIDLKPLNVIIGPNASGKSNLIEAISLLQAAPTYITTPIREGGGIMEWLWKGSSKSEIAEINATINYPQNKEMPLRYKLDFTEVNQRFSLEDESIEDERLSNSEGKEPNFYSRRRNGAPFFNTSHLSSRRKVNRTKIDNKRYTNKTVLSQIKDPVRHPEITYLSDNFTGIKIFKEWSMWRNTPPRKPQPADSPEDFLEEDASNIALIINDLQHQPESKQKLLHELQKFYEEITDITVKIHGGTVQIYFHERGLKKPIPATRLSDGTLRYLCLLSILIHPSPPPLICIEEPELGLHPDIISNISELLIEASQKTQLIVTTHSDALVSSFTDTPEHVMVCSKDDEGTKFKRLEKEALQNWLDDYDLGHLWRMGEIGGNRW